jgi:predicted nucleotidyltransferase
MLYPYESMRNNFGLTIAQEIASEFSVLPEVEAVVVSGSVTHEKSDSLSDIDLYIYAKSEIPLSFRSSLLNRRARKGELNNRFWETGDEWIEKHVEVSVDIMFRTPEWIEEQLNRVLEKHIASIGYSTCFWHNVLSSQILFDRNHWFHHLQEDARQPYPEPLRMAIIRKNHPILRKNISSYLHQIERAVSRHDPVSIHHRTTALLSSYFDIIFAVNRIPHPGEKRLLSLVADTCSSIPEEMQKDVQLLLQAAGNADPAVTGRINLLIDRLDQFLFSYGIPLD